MLFHITFTKQNLVTMLLHILLCNTWDKTISEPCSHWKENYIWKCKIYTLCLSFSKSRLHNFKHTT